MDLFGDHTSACIAHSGATKAHDWAVGVLGPLFRSAGHVVRSQHQVTASAGQRRGDVEVRNYLHNAAGSRSLVFDSSITHDRIRSSCHVQQNCLLSHPQDLDAPLRLAAQRKIKTYKQQYADNQKISFLPAIMTTSESSRMHGVFLRLLFVQGHRETTAHFTATGLPLQENRWDNAFRFKRRILRAARLHAFSFPWRVSVFMGGVYRESLSLSLSLRYMEGTSHVTPNFSVHSLRYQDSAFPVS